MLRSVSLFVFVFILSFYSTKAQNAAQYIFSASSGTYTNVAGGTAVSILQDDAYTANLPIGFSFNFCGNPYNTFTVSSNGWVSFTNPGDYWLDNTVLGNIVPAVMPLWDDLAGTATATAVYQTTGALPNRVFTMEWRNWEWNYGASSPVISVQLKLYETTNVIQFIYRQEGAPVNISSTTGATIGIARTAGDFLVLNNSTAAPVASSTAYTTNIVAKPATGQVYTFTPPPPCGGLPTAGTASGPALACPNQPFNLTLAGQTSATGIVIQWQSSPPGANTWTDIPGANSNPYSATQTVATDYRAKVTCTAPGGGVSYSNVVQVAMNSFFFCYCNNSTATSSADTEIFGVMFHTLNQTSSCGGIYNGMYTDYRSNGPGTDVKMGYQYPMAIELATCGGDYDRAAKVYIDYNQDAVFSDPAELVLGNYYAGSTPNPQTMSGIITVAAGNPAGVTGMRVVYVETGSLGGVTPCGNYGWGETEDYLINIVYAPAPPVISATANPVCSGDTVTITANSSTVGGTLYWTGPLGFTASGTNAVTFNGVTTARHGLYTVRVVYGQDTSAPATYFLTVNQTPTAPVAPASLVQYCINDAASPLMVYGNNLLWYQNADGGVGTATAPTINTSVVGSTVWFVSQSNLGCEGPRTMITSTVAVKPPLPVVKDTTYFCESEAAPALTAIGENLKWYPELTGGFGAVVPPIPNTSAPDTIIWYVSQTIDGCEGERSRMVIIVTPRPNALIQSSRKWICQYDTVTVNYFGSANNITAYNWGFPTGTVVLNGDPQGPFVIRIDSAGIQRITLSVAIGNCISDVEEHFIEVRPEPHLVTNIKRDICPEDLLDVRLGKGYTETIDKFDWDFGGGKVIYGRYDTGPYSIKFDNAGEYYIKLVGTDDQCKSLPHIDTVTVHPSPDPKIEGYQGDELCNGDSIKLSARTIRTGSAYTWAPVRFFDEYSTQPVTFARIDFGTYVALSVQDEFGCTATDSIMIRSKPCCELYFPTAFSPNGDGKNDVFRMINNGKHKLQSFRVLNRWGQAVYESGDERFGWDGTLNGKPMDIGTYFYQAVFRCDNKETVQSGEVILVR